MTIPVVDFAKWHSGATEDRTGLARMLVDACRQVGFVYIANHGVPQDTLDEAFDWSRRLFDLPTDQKMLAPHPPGEREPKWTCQATMEPSR